VRKRHLSERKAPGERETGICGVLVGGAFHEKPPGPGGEKKIAYPGQGRKVRHRKKNNLQKKTPVAKGPAKLLGRKGKGQKPGLVVSKGELAGEKKREPDSQDLKFGHPRTHQLKI